MCAIYKIASLAFVYIAVLHTHLSAADDPASVMLQWQGNDAQLSNVLIEFETTVRGENERASNQESKDVLELRIDPSVDRTGMPSEEELAKLYVLYFRSGFSLDNDRVDSGKLVDNGKWIDLFRSGKIGYVKMQSPTVKKEESKRTISDVLALRWPNLALMRTHEGEVTTRIVVDEQKVHFFYPVYSGGQNEWILNERVISSFPNVYHQTSLSLQWALGVGYSRMIDSISSVEKMRDGTTVVEAKLNYWGIVSGVGRFVIGDVGVVQRASLTFHNDVIERQLEIETTGVFEDAQRPFRCARSGRIVERRGQRICEDEEFHLTDVTFNMTDSQFATVSDLSSPENEALYRVTDTGVETLRVASSGQRRTFVLPLISVNLAVVVAIIILLVIKRRKESKCTLQTDLQ